MIHQNQIHGFLLFIDLNSDYYQKLIHIQLGLQNSSMQGALNQIHSMSMEIYENTKQVSAIETAMKKGFVCRSAIFGHYIFIMLISKKRKFYYNNL